MLGWVQTEGITPEIMASALASAKVARRTILSAMSECSPPPRMDLSPYTPRILRTYVELDKLGSLIGTGGRTIKAINVASGCTSIQV